MGCNRVFWIYRSGDSTGHLMRQTMVPKSKQASNKNINKIFRNEIRLSRLLSLLYISPKTQLTILHRISKEQQKEVAKFLPVLQYCLSFDPVLPPTQPYLKRFDAIPSETPPIP
jgi:hypothetical protein